MDERQEKEYRGLVRGAATFILLKQVPPPMDANMIAQLFDADLAQVTADIDAIVQKEHAKVGGAFELEPGPAVLIRK